MDLLCGVPYTALPLATLISAAEDVPMLVRRKEAKDYGTKKMVEGKFSEGESCLIVEDVVTSGTSVLETAELLRSMGLKVTDAVVLLNREQGGEANLARNGIRLHSVCGMTKMVEVLKEAGRIDGDTAGEVLDFAKNNQIAAPGSKLKAEPAWMAPISGRLAHMPKGGVSRRLMETALRKKTILTVAVDVPKAEKVLEIAEKVAPYVCCIKTHVDSIGDWSDEWARKLAGVAERGDFLLFEDRKYADIGNTVASLYAYVVDWADIVTFHGLPGKSVVDGIRSVAESSAGGKTRGAIVMAEMSSKDNLFSADYTKKCAALCDGQFVFGYVGQSRQRGECAELVQFTPGVSLAAKGDALGQQYVSPEEAVLVRGADIVIVGRGVVAAEDVAAAAEKYRDAAWAAMQKRCSN